jgi:hypothetical protein
MADLTEKLQDVRVKASAALETAAGDDGASPVLTAVVREFVAKCDKALSTSRSGGDAREAVVELEQAGDSAKAAAEADGGASDATKSVVLDAHLAICMLKAET